MSEFKPGDRVKVEYETEFVRASDRADEAVVRHPTLTNCYATALVSFSALTRLPDPEPEWRKGDVVRWKSERDGAFHVAVRGGGTWACSCGVEPFRDYHLRPAWLDGRLEVLHREDQP